MSDDTPAGMEIVRISESHSSPSRLPNGSVSCSWRPFESVPTTTLGRGAAVVDAAREHVQLGLSVLVGRLEGEGHGDRRVERRCEVDERQVVPVEDRLRNVGLAALFDDRDDPCPVVAEREVGLTHLYLVRTRSDQAERSDVSAIGDAADVLAALPEERGRPADQLSGDLRSVDGDLVGGDGARRLIGEEVALPVQEHLANLGLYGDIEGEAGRTVHEPDASRDHPAAARYCDGGRPELLGAVGVDRAGRQCQDPEEQHEPRQEPERA